MDCRVKPGNDDNWSIAGTAYAPVTACSPPNAQTRSCLDSPALCVEPFQRRRNLAARHEPSDRLRHAPLELYRSVAASVSLGRERLNVLAGPLTPVFCLPRPFACASCLAWRPTDICRLAVRAATWRLAPFSLHPSSKPAGPGHPRSQKPLRVLQERDCLSLRRLSREIRGCPQDVHRNARIGPNSKNTIAEPAESWARRAGAAARRPAPAGRPAGSRRHRTPNRAPGCCAP